MHLSFKQSERTPPTYLDSLLYNQCMFLLKQLFFSSFSNLTLLSSRSHYPLQSIMLWASTYVYQMPHFLSGQGTHCEGLPWNNKRPKHEQRSTRASNGCRSIYRPATMSVKIPPWKERRERCAPHAWMDVFPDIDKWGQRISKEIILFTPAVGFSTSSNAPSEDTCNLLICCAKPGDATLHLNTELEFRSRFVYTSKICHTGKQN